MVSLAIMLAAIAFAIGLYSGYKQNAVFGLVTGVLTDVKLVYDESHNLLPGGDPTDFLQRARKPGAGVTVNRRANDGKLVLLAGFFDGGNEVRLVRRDGSAVARWPVRFSRHFPDASHLSRKPGTDRNVDVHGALINPDGSIVFNYEYSGTVKLSKCNETVWVLAHPTHHSVEAAEAGGYWIPGQRLLSGAGLKEFSPFSRLRTDHTFTDDLILRVSEDGRIAEQRSVTRILHDNGLEALLTAGMTNFHPGDIVWDLELVHLNKIAELRSAVAGAFPAFRAGDLAISLRTQNLVLVVDPRDWRVKWHQTGPWLRQHDPRFHADGTISVFNNNAYNFELDRGLRSNPATPRISNITKVHPATGRAKIVYGGNERQSFLTVIRGKHQPTAEGGFLITEHEAGRVFEVDAQGETVWEFINRYDADRVLELSDALLYPMEYFSVKDWSCPGATTMRGK
jgi:hypothetical protein